MLQVRTKVQRCLSRPNGNLDLQKVDCNSVLPFYAKPAVTGWHKNYPSGTKDFQF